MNVVVLKFEARSNVVPYLNDRDPKAVGYWVAIAWLKTSPISFALLHNPVIDQQHTRDFWETTDYDLGKKPREITATV